jgi:hypothetical protein
VGSLMQDWQASPASSPHSSLGYRTPNEYAQALAKQFDGGLRAPKPRAARRDGIFALSVQVIRVRVSPILSTPRGMNSSIQRAWEAGWRQQLRDAVSAGGEVFRKILTECHRSRAEGQRHSTLTARTWPGYARRGKPDAPSPRNSLNWNAATTFRRKPCADQLA